MKRRFPFFAIIFVIATFATTASAASGTLSNLHKKPWKAYGEYAPKYNICKSCGGGVTYAIDYGHSSPSLSGSSTKFSLGGTTPYSDALFVKPAIGNMPNDVIDDSNKKIVNTIHDMVYDVYFWGGDLSVSQVLEFDVSMFFNGHSLIFGTQCRIAGGHAWDIWNSSTKHWVSANVSCNPKSQAWNHVQVQFHRSSTGNKLTYKSITLNGKTVTINRTFDPATAPSDWWGITLNFQMDGNKYQKDYSIYLDKMNFKYW
jgi:hypothetical protein